MVQMKFGGEYLKGRWDERFRNTDFSEKRSLLSEGYLSAFEETDIFWSKHLVSRIGLRVEHSDLLGRWNIAPRFSIAYLLGKNEQI